MYRDLPIYFKSGLTEEETLKKFEGRADKVHSVKGLVQKFYIKDESTDQFGGVYIFNSKENLKAFRDSDLMKSIGDSYKVQSTPTI